MLTDHDIYLFREGSHGRLYEQMGCHLGGDGGNTSFAVWAPNASRVSVIGDFNGWNGDANPLTVRDDGSGILGSGHKDTLPSTQRRARISRTGA